jgi:pilus assembly protein Flp/PilA
MKVGKALHSSIKTSLNCTKCRNRFVEDDHSIYQEELRRGSAMVRMIRLFLTNDAGATAIEYALIAGALSIAIVVAVQGIGSSLNSTLTSVSTGLK